MLYSSFGVVAPDAAADFNGDGKVAFSDFQILELSFGQSLPLAAPEQQAPVRGVKWVSQSLPVPVRPPSFANAPHANHWSSPGCPRESLWQIGRAEVAVADTGHR